MVQRFYTFSFQQLLQKSNIDTKNYHFKGTYLFPNHDFGYPGYPAVSFQGCRWCLTFFLLKIGRDQKETSASNHPFSGEQWKKTLVILGYIGDEILTSYMRIIS